MDSESIKQLSGIAMDQGEINQFLTDRGTGVLSLSDNGDSYAVPISFGFDGSDALYFFLLKFGEESLKLQFAESTREACFVTYQVETKHKWKSVVIRGPLEITSNEDHEQIEKIITDNAWFPSLFPFSEPLKQQYGFRMELQHVSGQKGHGYEYE